MSTIKEQLIKLRKDKNWSQDVLAKEIGSSRVMIGKYERGDNTPSIDVIIKLAKVFDVSIDYLVGLSLNAHYDKEMLNRLDSIELLPPSEKKRIFDYVDLVLRDFKAKQAYS